MTHSDAVPFSITAHRLSPTARSTVYRNKERAQTDRDWLYRILDAGLLCHFGVEIGGSPRVVPTGYGRVGETLYLHGSTGASSLREAMQGKEICVTVTQVDAIVYSRSLMHHSMNYKSAMVHGVPRAVTDADEKWAALRAICQQLAPGSWDYARQPSKRELAATSVLALDLYEAAVKVRAGGPSDDQEDIDAGKAWAGVLPLRTTWGEPQPAADLAPSFPVPEHISSRS